MINARTCSCALASLVSTESPRQELTRAQTGGGLVGSLSLGLWCADEEADDLSHTASFLLERWECRSGTSTTTACTVHVSQSNFVLQPEEGWLGVSPWVCGGPPRLGFFALLRKLSP